MTKTASLLTAAALLIVAAAARAERLGEHPAVVAKRLHAQATYDYASKFYPHPAWLYLSMPAPADLVAKRGGPRRDAPSDVLVAAQRAAQIDSQPDSR
jgi:hypothetical protein